jgi:hypothetical protein
MRPSLFYRLATIVNLLFAVGHTAGFLTFMAIAFNEDGTRFSYAGFYNGFGLTCTLAMLLIAVWSWWLGSLARTMPRATILPGTALLAYQIGALVLAVLYFPAPAVMFSAVLPILYGLAVAGAARA